ncbi:MAG TPA: alpha/beta hydrolase, partial [Pyrinomonadaceae bacterium]|nr:alpha/beta hydrolase [Pyrinomonadaceae bacterium]
GNRLSMRLGSWSGMLSPLLTLQLKPRLGISADALRPIDKVGAITTPKLFIVGAEDQHTTLEESQRIFAAAAEPKELWIVAGATHTDLHAKNREEYELRVTSFLKNHVGTVKDEKTSRHPPEKKSLHTYVVRYN